MTEATPTKSPVRRLERYRWLAVPILWYLAARAAVLVGLLIGDLATGERLSNKLSRWDGQWFLSAATQGWPRHLIYENGHVIANPISFFPALPLAIRWISEATGISPVGIGIAISFVTGLTATISVALLVKEFAGERAAVRASVLFAIFPATFVFSLIYAEGTVITAMALGLLCLMRRRWVLAGLLGALASFTTPIALAFVLSCAWVAVDEIRRRRDWSALLAPVIAPMGMGFYMVWLWRHTGSINAWRLTERGGWNSYPSLSYPFVLVKNFALNPVGQVKTTDLLIVGMIFAAVAIVLAIRQRQPMPVLIYALGVVAMALFSYPVSLRPRFLLLAFPLVAAVGIRLEGRGYKAAVAVSAIGFLGLTGFEFYSWAIFP